MLNFVVLHKIGNKNPLISLWIWSTLRQYVDWVWIGFVGSQQEIEVLRLEDSIFLSTLLPLIDRKSVCRERV